MIKIAVVNESSVLTDTEVAAAVVGLHKQVTKDLHNTWGISAGVYFYTQAQVIPPSYWEVHILDNSDQAGALGYHDLTANGLPLSKVFTQTDAKYGLS